MLTSLQSIEELVEALEVRFLANQDENLHFGLLTDFKDSEQEKRDEDDQLIELVSKKIEELNEKYQGENKEYIFSFSSSPKMESKRPVMDGL